jgi:hypothetical protein
MALTYLQDTRGGKNVQHELVSLFHTFCPLTM